MMRFTFFFILAGSVISSGAQDPNALIQEKEVERIERILSSDDMKGRAVFTPGIDSAAEFIAGEFRRAGLVPVAGDSYFQEFSLQRNRFVSASGSVNSQGLDPKNIVAFTSRTELTLDETSGYEKIRIGPADTLFNRLMRLMNTGKNYLLLVDSVHVRNFNNLKRFRQMGFPTSGNLVLILTGEDAVKYSVRFVQEVSEMKLKNVVGMLPGNSRKDESVIFSAHYDHLGIRKPNSEMDSIYNGANDDAAGTTAVIMLAKYFSSVRNNNRTLVFSAFTAEESGGFGSQYFSRQFNPDSVVAMFNIEMIGTDSKWGENSAYITGYEKTDMGKILVKNLAGTGFQFYPDPYPQQNLFYRSDNATLARLGVPAHTISTSKMDSEKFYHTADDEIETLDMKNMTAIIRAIALSSRTIISGEDTPSRVNTAGLR